MREFKILIESTVKCKWHRTTLLSFSQVKSFERKNVFGCDLAGQKKLQYKEKEITAKDPHSFFAIIFVFGLQAFFALLKII